MSSSVVINQDVMKNLVIFLIFSLTAAGLQAQAYDPLFIFDQFLSAKIHFKNRSVTVANMNYDAVNDRMYFKQGEDMMELTNAAMIDSISWAGKRCFVPREKGYMEKVIVDNGTVYIAWRIQNVNVGSKGALGAVTQGKVETISIRSLGVFSATDAKGHSADVFQQKNNNEYYLSINGKLEKINNIKQAQKLYPAHKEAIRSFVKEHNINMKEPLSALEFLNYCLGL